MSKRIIKTEDYCGEDRRGIKIGKDFITPTVIVTLVIGLMAIGGYKFVIQATAETVKFHTDQLIYLDKQANTIDKKVGRLETEIPNIKESIIRIETSQLETQKDIKLLLRKIPDGR